MEGETPTFCKELLDKNNCSFSSACDKVSKLKLGKSSSFKKPIKKGISLQVKAKSKFRKESTEGEHKKRRHHHSQKIKSKNIYNINDFMKNHKFKLRNDFDKKHVEKFLSSKEEAFKIPFLFSEEFSSTTVKS